MQIYIKRDRIASLIGEILIAGYIMLCCSWLFYRRKSGARR